MNMLSFCRARISGGRSRTIAGAIWTESQNASFSGRVKSVVSMTCMQIKGNVPEPMH